MAEQEQKATAEVKAPAQAAAAPVAPGTTVKALSGFEEGEVLPDGEVVRGSYDEDGKLVGWHKEPVEAPAPAAAEPAAEQPAPAASEEGKQNG